MSVVNQFSQRRGSNQAAVTGAASASVTVNPLDKALRLVNSGAALVYVRVGNGAQTATTADVPILPNTALIIRKAVGDNTVAHISPGGASALQIATGEGGV